MIGNIQKEQIMWMTRINTEYTKSCNASLFSSKQVIRRIVQTKRDKRDIFNNQQKRANP